MWNKTKYNSNLSTINFTKQCKQLQELFDILQTPVSYSGLKQVSNVKTITKAITSDRITKWMIFPSLDINRASIS